MVDGSIYCELFTFLNYSLQLFQNKYSMAVIMAFFAYQSVFRWRKCTCGNTVRIMWQNLYLRGKEKWCSYCSRFIPNFKISQYLFFHSLSLFFICPLYRICFLLYPIYLFLMLFCSKGYKSRIVICHMYRSYISICHMYKSYILICPTNRSLSHVAIRMKRILV